jgi:hypothetical protein
MTYAFVSANGPECRTFTVQTSSEDFILDLIDDATASAKDGKVRR